MFQDYVSFTLLYTNLLTKITHVDHDLQISATDFCPAEKFLQVWSEGLDKRLECLCLRVGGTAPLQMLCLRH